MHPFESTLADADTRVLRRDEPQRRAHERVEAEFDVSFVGENNFYVGFSENISEGGLFVATAELLKVGERVTAKFTLPGIDAPSEVQCVVRWIRQPAAWSHDMPGMGLQFVAIDDATRALIERFLAKRTPLFFDDEALSGQP